MAAEVDPEIRFGRPRIPGTGIPTAIIYQRRRAGETAEQLAAVYDRRVAEVTSAISYKKRAALRDATHSTFSVDETYGPRLKYVKRNFLPVFREAQKERGHEIPDAGEIGKELDRKL